jgi:hypothetical protein
MKVTNIKKRYKIITGIILVIALVLFAVPRASRLYIVKHSIELTGRRLAIDKIRFNYFTGTLSITNFKLFEADSKTVFLSFNRLKINLDYLPLFRNEIHVRYIILDDPNVQVLQNGDLFNFSDLIKSDTTAAIADTVPVKPLKYDINNITISRGFVKYTDQVLNHSISMNRVDLNIPGFTWNSDSTNLGIDFRFTDGGRLFSNLKVNQSDSTYLVKLKLDSLNLNIIEPYVENSMYISDLRGYLSNDITIKGDLRSIMKLSLNGMNHIFDFQLLDTLKRTIFSFDDLTIDFDTLLLNTNKLSINSLEIKKPYILFELIDTTNNWLTLMKPEQASTPDTLGEKADTTGNNGQSSFSFSKMKISEGKVSLSDKTLRYPFDYDIENIMVGSTPDSRQPGWIDVSMSAGLNGTGNFKADFALNPRKSSDMDISLTITQFTMKDLDPYFRNYFGFPVTGGRMNYSTQNKLRANSLISNNSIYFRKFTLGKKSDGKTEYNIPLRLALGVMSDKDGIIDLKAPVEMKGEDVKVGNIRKIVFHAIGNLFVKAAVSPVNMIADLFKVDPEKLKEIHLLLTDPAPDEQNSKTVDILADILDKKPGLNLDLIYCSNPEKASDSLAHLLALEDYKRSAGITGDNSGSVPDSLLSKYLLGKMPSDSALANAGLKVLSRKYEGEGNLKMKLDSIKNSQISFLQSYLSRDKTIPEVRFRIIAEMPDSIKYDEPDPAFKTYFTAGDEK